jgi:hypothetical protein
MSDSLIARLPEIAIAGRKEAENILERVESSQDRALQVNEYVLPMMDSSAVPAEKWSNRLLHYSPGRFLKYPQNTGVGRGHTTS